MQVPRMPALHRLARELHDFGFNLLMIEWEAAFPFAKHAVISNRYAYRRAEVAGLVRDCRRLGIDVVPLQQTFGHVEYILRHPRYAALREDEKDLCQVCPSRPGAVLPVLREILADVASLHPSDYFHIGGDETYLLGHCPVCRERSRRDGKSRVYVDHVAAIARAVRDLGKRPLLWADMLLKHPEAADALPNDCIFIDWNYGWDPARFGDHAALRRRGFEFWGACALRSAPDNHSLTAWRRHFGNLRDYLPFARQQEFGGMIVTSWSTSGVYGYEWDLPGEPLRLFPIRRVYPHSGFRLLLAAFARAVGQAEPLDAAEFVRDYGVDRFGLTAGQARRLWRALDREASPPGRDADPAPLLRSAAAAARLVGSLRPRRHREEFAHLRLMCDLRLHDLRFRQVERLVQSPRADRRGLRREARRLDALRAAARGLDRRFARLQRAFLQAAEIREENAYRNRRLHELQARLHHLGRGARGPAT